MKNIICLGVVSLVAACGGGSGSISINDLGARLKAADCRFAVACHTYPDEGTCEAAFDANQDMNGIVKDVNNNVIKYDDAAAGQCIDDLNALTCDQTDINGFYKFYYDCQEVLKGTLAEGATCVRSEECQSLDCSFSTCSPNMCCQGTCGPAQPPLAADGAPCGNAGCVVSDTCITDPTTGNATCKPRVTQGGTCNEGDCAEGLTCVLDSTGAGTCQTPLASGAACFGYGGCGTGLTCIAGACTPFIAVGGACDPNNFGECVQWADCDSATSTCKALALPGAACNTATATFCLAGNCSSSNTCPTLAMSCSLTP
jgi:hypothetical protein